MTLRLITPPAAEPLSLTELRTYARLDTDNSPDALLTMLLTAARTVAENRTGRALITQTWELVLDKFPAAELELGMLPLQSITSVKYYDGAGVLQTLVGTAYALDADTLPGWLLPAYNTTWPDTYAIANAVIIRFVAGYGAAGSFVPAELRMWIAAQVAAAYNNPDGTLPGSSGGLFSAMSAALPFIDGLLDAYRIRFF